MDPREVPTLLIDATARVEVVRQYFPSVEIAADVHIETPHQCVKWVCGNFSKQRLTNTPSALARLRRFIEVTAAEHRGQGYDGIDMLIVVNQAVESLLKDVQLPANVAVEHFNNLRGVNLYSGVRAVMTVNKTLPRLETLVRDAETLAGRTMEPSDPFIDDVRWLTCEAELVQVIARARGVRRTAESPVDVIVLNDEWRLPIAVDAVVEWKDVEPHPLALMEARGVVPDCETSAKGFWSMVATVLSDVYPSKEAARMAMSSREGILYSPLYGNPSRELWLRGEPKPAEARYTGSFVVRADCADKFKWAKEREPGYLVDSLLQSPEPSRASFVSLRDARMMAERYAYVKRHGMPQDDEPLLVLPQ